MLISYTGQYIIVFKSHKKAGAKKLQTAPSWSSHQLRRAALLVETWVGPVKLGLGNLTQLWTSGKACTEQTSSLVPSV